MDISCLSEYVYRCISKSEIEVTSLFRQMDGIESLAARLLYGAGLRLSECRQCSLNCVMDETLSPLPPLRGRQKFETHINFRFPYIAD